ncbi:MAG: pyridoxal-phosphate dependent enzyme [Phototrophicaceae bacterium]
MPLHSVTPIFQNAAIDARLNQQIHFKMDCYQAVGSFKIRGIGALCQHAQAEGKSRLISSSGGNAGYAAAYAGKQLGIPVTVVVPNTTSETAIQRMREQDAEVIIHGNVWNEADAHAQALVAENDNAYIHPFDNPIIWDGHATIIHEAVTQISKPDAVVVAVGGGGLLAGVLTGMHAHNWHDVPVIAVETEGAASFAATANTGVLTRITEITSIAKTLGALQVADALVDWLDKHPITAVQVSDADAVNACLQFADDFRAIVEPACGAALSLVYDKSHYLQDYDNVLMIVCGGAGATIQQLLRWQELSYAN